MTQEELEPAAVQITEAVYRFICETLAARGYPPSQREIASAVFISAGSVVRHLDRLEMWGRITRDAGKARSIRLVSTPPKV